MERPLKTKVGRAFSCSRCTRAQCETRACTQQGCHRPGSLCAAFRLSVVPCKFPSPNWHAMGMIMEPAECHCRCLTVCHGLRLAVLMRPPSSIFMRPEWRKVQATARSANSTSSTHTCWQSTRYTLHHVPPALGAAQVAQANMHDS